MFTLPHFIWLAIFAVLIVSTLLLVKKFKPSHNIVSKCAMVFIVAFKILHIALSLKESEFGGMILKQNQLSFHLCSIQIYLLIAINFIKNEKFVSTIKCFMVPCMVIGAMMALLIPTEGVSPSSPRVWQFMMIHAGLVFYGFYLMLIEKVDLSFKSYIRNIELLLVVVAVAFLMNSVLEPYATNFLYLRKPPMDNLPILNLDNGWYVYFITLFIIAVSLITIVHLPFMLKKKKDAICDKEVNS